MQVRALNERIRQLEASAFDADAQRRRAAFGNYQSQQLYYTIHSHCLFWFNLQMMPKELLPQRLQRCKMLKNCRIASRPFPN
jgi:hypothetical protein